MFDCGSNHKPSLIKLDDLESKLLGVTSSGKSKMSIFRFNLSNFLSGRGGAGHGRLPSSPSKTYKKGFRVKSFGQSLRLGVGRAVFAEDLKVSEKKIFDPQDKFLQLWNRLFVISCILAVSIDPLFFFLPVIQDDDKCLNIDRSLAITTTTLRTLVDGFYLIRMAFQFRTAFIAPSSRVFGRGELVIDSAQIAASYMRKLFWIDLLSILPFPQTVIWKFLNGIEGISKVQATKQALLYIVLIQYIPRFYRILPLTSQLKKTSGVFAESAFAGAAYYLSWYMLCSHIVGAYWYLLSIQRNDDCWEKACKAVPDGKCDTNFLYCGNSRMAGYEVWRNISNSVLTKACYADNDNTPFDFGIYQKALDTGILMSTMDFVSKYLYCLWWGLQNLSSLGQGLETSTYPGEVVFSILFAISGLILFALLIGNMQTYLESLTIRVEEMRLKRRDAEQWMHHRLLPLELRERVRRYEQFKWLQTRGVDEEDLVQSLPKDLRRDIKRHLCLALVRRVPLFENMDERLLDAICERLKPSLYTQKSYILREGDPVDEMLFIIRGRLESVTTDGGRSGFYNRSLLKEGDFCGEELLTWALDPKSGANFPSSTRTVKAISEVEAFALIAEELKYVATQFRRLHSRQVQDTFRFYSQQWRTWAACYIQAAWRRYTKRKIMDFRRRDEEDDNFIDDYGRSSSSTFGESVYASRF